MKRLAVGVSVLLLLSILVGGVALLEVNSAVGEEEVKIELPEVSQDGDLSVEEALDSRRSIREYSGGQLTLEEIGQLVWAAQGVTEESQGFRTAPSAGALYPLEVYVVTGGTKDGELTEGVYHYQPKEHELVKMSENDKRDDLYQAGLYQEPILEAPVSIVISGVYKRTTQRYSERGIRYAHMEVGHAAQNIYLQAESLNLGTVIIGAFNEKQYKDILNLGEEEEALAILPVGRK